MEYRFIVSGGGTSGHINPAITIADTLKRRLAERGDTCEIVFTGRQEGLEGELVPKAGYKLIPITAKPFPMKPDKRAFEANKAIMQGRRECRKIIKEFNPDAVIGTGGYVCAPLLIEAHIHKIPVLIHEANAFPGRANRLLSRRAALVMTGFPGLEKTFRTARKVVCTGNPVRKAVLDAGYEQSRKNLGLSDDELLVFAMGGSLGAKTINDFIRQAAGDPELSDVKFVLSTGKQQTDHDADKTDIPANLDMREYIENPSDYLCGADIAITRAGAVTCAEVACIGACSIMIHYPFAAQDHQTFNARSFFDVGGNMMFSDQEVKDGKLLPALKELLKDKQKRMSMRENAKKLAVRDCDDRIFEEIMGVVSKDG